MVTSNSHTGIPEENSTTPTANRHNQPQVTSSPEKEINVPVTTDAPVGSRKEKSVLQAKLTKLAIQIGYAGKQRNHKLWIWFYHRTNVSRFFQQVLSLLF